MKIRIKKKNRGKFTALKKRTGKSASWFKAHGTPAQKKMATFALNAKKWKHGDGGFLQNYFAEGGDEDRIPNWVVRGQDYSEWKPSDIQEIINWGYTDPESFFGQAGESTRDALSRAGMADSVIGDIYANMDPALQEKFGDRYKGTAQRQQEFQSEVTNAIDTAGQNIFNTVDSVAQWLPGPVGTMTWLGHMGADLANGNYGNLAGQAVMAGLMGGAGKIAGKYVPRLISKSPWLSEHAGRFGDFLDDFTWNDARRADASDLWSRNLDARQRWAVYTGGVDPENGAGLLSMIPGKARPSYLKADAFDSDLLDSWLQVTDGNKYDKLMLQRRKELGNRLLDMIDPNTSKLSPGEVDALRNGTMSDMDIWSLVENSRMGIPMFKKFKKFDPKPGFTFDDMVKLRKKLNGLGHVQMIDKTADYPLSLDITPFTNKLDEVVNARNMAYDMLYEAAKQGKLSPYRWIKADSDPTGKMGIVAYTQYPTRETMVRKPILHFGDRDLMYSFADNRPVVPWISVGMRDVFTGSGATRAAIMDPTAYGTDLFFEPLGTVAHEVGHMHPAYNNGHLFDAATVAFLKDTGRSPAYGNSYEGIDSKLAGSLKAKVLPPDADLANHDSELSESVSDALGDRVLMSMFGIHDWRKGTPYTSDHVKKLMEKTGGLKTRLRHQHPDEAEYLKILNEGWAEGGPLNKIASKYSPDKLRKAIANLKSRM